MAARNKSKKTAKSKAKKKTPASSAKAPLKRVKRASSSSVRSRVGKSKAASSARTGRKTIRAKMKNIVAKPLKRKRKSPGAAVASRTRGAAKRLAKAVSARKPGGFEEPWQGCEKRNRFKGDVDQPRSREGGGETGVGSRVTPEVRSAPEKAVTPVAGPKPGPAHGNHVPAATTEPLSTARSNPPAVRIQKVGGSEDVAAKSLKAASQRQGFRLNEFVVYPAMGSGRSSRSKNRKSRASDSSCSSSVSQRTS